MEAKEFGKLIRSITSNINTYIGARVEKHGIKQGQYEYFMLIYSTPGINQLELSRLKNVGKASVTKALKILEDSGFIERRVDENDRRNTLCYVTKKGELIIEDLIHVRKNVEEELFQGFSEEEKSMLFKHLTILEENSSKLISDLTPRE